MIVDDEYLVRIGIRSMLDWEKHGYTIVCDAVSGQDAIDKIARYSPQIILTDLVMDPVSGLELIEYCSKNAPDIKVIVLSNYNDFEKVKTAMKLGAYDFIFKLTVNPDELIAVLDSVSKEIDAWRLSGKDAEKLLWRNIGAIRKRLIHAMVEQSYASDDDLMNELRLIEVKCDFYKPYVILYLSVANFGLIQSAGILKEPDLFGASLENIVEEIMGDISDSQAFQYENGQCFIVINLPSEGLNNVFIRKMDAGFMRIKDCIFRYFGIQINGVLSSKITGLKAFSPAASDCMRKMNSRYYLKENKLILSVDEKPQQQEHKMPENLSLSYWKTSLEHFNFTEAKLFLQRFIGFFYGREDVESYPVREKLYELYRLMKVDGHAKGIAIDKLTDKYGMTLYQAISQHDLLLSTEESFMEILDKYTIECSKNGNRKPKKVIARILTYVKDNLSGDLSISAITKVFHFSESYFSHLFKREMGISFIDYVNRLRVEKAMELLTETDKNITEISYEVGINNPNYFSILFKKHVKVSPNEYRNNIIAK